MRAHFGTNRSAAQQHQSSASESGDQKIEIREEKNKKKHTQKTVKEPNNKKPI